jgi:MFS family permease
VADETSAQLQRERGMATAAIAGAALAALLPMAGGILGGVVLGDQPKDSTSELLYVHDHAGALISSAALLGLGALAMVLPLRYLYLATKHRRPELPRVALFCAVFGPVALAIGQVALQVVLASKAAAFADPARGDQTYEEAKDVLESGAVQTVRTLGFASALALGFGFVLISLNAMRVGLLTRFMGILGMIVGALFVLPLAPGPPVVQSFWLGALAFLMAGRWPNGVPPAWRSGKAEPWPSQQELRERRERERERARPAPQPEPVPAAAAEGKPHSASKKRKRKKRR